jgi:hypothetical protein
MLSMDSLLSGAYGLGAVAAEPSKLFDVANPHVPIVIGLEAPLTGDQRGNGRDMWRGAKLAVKELNREGGILGRRVKLVRADDRADPDRALPNVDPAFVTDAGLNVARSVVLSGVPEAAQLPHADAYVQDYEQRFGRTPGVWGTFTYDSMKVLAEAIETAGSTAFRPALDSLLQTRNYKGAIGTTTIDPLTGNRVDVPVFILNVDAKRAFTPVDSASAVDPLRQVPMFTTSNQLLVETAVPTAGVKPVGIGDLQSFLESEPGVVRSSVSVSNGGSNYDLDILEVPKGILLHKALKVPPNGLFAQDDILNRFAVSTNWYSSFDVASAYANSDWSRSQGWQVVEFKTSKALRLIDLAEEDTLGYVWASLQSDLGWMESQLLLLRGDAPPTANPKAIAILKSSLDELRQDLEIVQLTTGYNATYAEQLDLLRKYGDAVTNDYSYDPDEEIARLGISTTDTFVVEDVQGAWRPATLRSSSFNNPLDVVTWGGASDELNRISFTTAIDKELTNILARYINVDGYFAPQMPSLFHLDGRLLEEVGLFVPRDSTFVAKQQVLGDEPSLRSVSKPARFLKGIWIGKGSGYRSEGYKSEGDYKFVIGQARGFAAKGTKQYRDPGSRQWSEPESCYFTLLAKDESGLWQISGAEGDGVYQGTTTQAGGLVLNYLEAGGASVDAALRLSLKKRR